MTDIIKTLEQDAVLVWTDFQKGVHWLETEATAVEKWLEKVDPAIASQFQNIIKDGEAEAASLAGYTGQALSGLIAAAIPEVESTLATLVVNSVGSNPTLTRGSAQVVADVGDIAQSVVKVALAKVIGGLAAGSNAATGH